jgi:dephospho-CoA kinase
MNVWGLTGNIACGKSAVEAMLREAGLPVIDMDRVARDVVEPGRPALHDIRAAFGDEVLHPDGWLDREALGRVIFADAGARKRLEAITHPRIFEQTAAELADLERTGQASAVVSAALMVESGNHVAYHGLAVVTCPEDVQLRRLLARDGADRERALARIRSQLPQADKAALADFVIDNGGAPEATRRQVAGLVRAITAGAVPGPAS